MAVQAEPLLPARYAEAANVLARAFQNDPVWARVFPDASKREAQLRWIFRKGVPMAAKFNASFITAGGEGVALWYPPGCDRETGLWRELLVSVPLGLLRLGPSTAIRLWPIYADVARRQREEVTEPLWELDTLGVDPAHQKKGVSSALVRPILAEADRAGLPCHVITHNPVNVAIYEHFGFRVLRRDTVPRANLFVCTLRRDPVRV